MGKYNLEKNALDKDAIKDLCELARNNSLGIQPEDSDYIVNNIETIFWHIYFLCKDWEKLCVLRDAIREATCLKADDVRSDEEPSESE